MNFFKNLDIKSWLILILLASTVLLFSMLFLKGSGSKDEINSLQNDIKKIQKERDSLANARIILQNEFINLKKQDSIKSIKILKNDSAISAVQSKLQQTQSDFNLVKKNLATAQQKLQDVMKSPANRTGDDLLNSLKNKSK